MLMYLRMRIWKLAIRMILFYLQNRFQRRKEEYNQVFLSFLERRSQRILRCYCIIQVRSTRWRIYTLIGNLIYDDIQTYARSRGSMSVSVVSISFLNVNANIRSSLVGTQYLGVVSAKDVTKDDSDLKKFTDLIIRHFYLAAKVGACSKVHSLQWSF